MLKHSIALGLFALQTLFATPSAAAWSKPETYRADTCGVGCVFPDDARSRLPT
jgi:hypothetical protein